MATRLYSRNYVTSTLGAGLGADPDTGLAYASTASVLAGAPSVDTGSWYGSGGSGGPIWVYETAQSLLPAIQVHEVDRIIHIDPVNGDDSNPGTRTSPKKTRRPDLWSGAVTFLQAYDMTLFKRGTVYVHSNASEGILVGQNQHIGSYGSLSLPNPVLRSTNDLNIPFVIGIISGGDCSVSDVDIDASDNPGRTGVLISAATPAAGGVDLTGIRLMNMDIKGVTCTVTGSGTNTRGTLRAGVRLVNNGEQSKNRYTPYPTMYDIDIINVTVHDCGYHGFHVAGVSGKVINGVTRGIRFIGCKALRNAWQFDGHGFSSFSQGTVRDILPSYNLVSGTVYYITTEQAFGGTYNLPSPPNAPGIPLTIVPDVEIVFQRITSPFIQTMFLRKNTSTPTNPAPGEFGFVGGPLVDGNGVTIVGNQRIYINTGYPMPTGTNIDFNFDACTYTTKYILYDRCFAQGTLWAARTGVKEAIGFAFDDLTSYCSIINCEASGNVGTGVSFNRGVFNTIYNSRFQGNQSGAWGGVALGFRAWGNWVEEYGSTNSGVLSFNPPAYYFRDMKNVLSGFKKLKYTGTDPNTFLVTGSPDFNSISVVIEDSLVDPGVGQLAGYGSGAGEGGFVLARGNIIGTDARSILISPNFSGF